MTRLPRCIYCREYKDPSLFNTEHVVNDAFGTYEQAMTLHKNEVCWACNTHFAKTLDSTLAHDSIEGLDRYALGLKRPGPRTHFGVRDARVRAHIREGFLQGARAYWAPNEQGDGLAMHYPEQVGFIYGELRHWAMLGALPAKSELAALGIPKGAVFDLHLTPGLSGEKVIAELEGKGFSDLRSANFGTVEGDKSTGISIRSRIDSTVQRAIAKIAFNYLAYHYGASVALMEQFDVIRQYIRYGTPQPTSPVTPLAAASVRFTGALAERARGRVPVAHMVAVQWRDGKVLGEVSLLWRVHYRIALAAGDDFLVKPERISMGHVFDPVNRQILELDPS